MLISRFKFVNYILAVLLLYYIQSACFYHQGDGILHRTDVMHGGIASKLKQGQLPIIAFPTLAGLVFLARSTTAAVLSNFPSMLISPGISSFTYIKTVILNKFFGQYTFSYYWVPSQYNQLACIHVINNIYGAATSTMDKPEKRQDWTFYQTQTLWKLIRLFPSRPRFGSG